MRHKRFRRGVSVHCIAGLAATTGCLAGGCGSTSGDVRDSSGARDGGLGGVDAASNTISIPTTSGATSGATTSTTGRGGTGAGGGISLGYDSGAALPQLVVGDAGPPTTTADPKTCAEAASAHTYVGCDYWPTVVANSVWSIFDYAVVVANTGTTTASVTVTGPANTNQTATVAPGTATPIYLPWVPSLKGPDQDNCGGVSPLTASVLAAGGAYHLISTVPVTVYQFNAFEYNTQAGAGPVGKNWSACPGLTACVDPITLTSSLAGCFSFTNDASLLLPSTAMTGNYRVVGHEGVSYEDPISGMMTGFGGYMAITATAPGTTVRVQVSSTGSIAAGTGIAATAAGGTLTLALNAGDVAELLGPGGVDLSGSVVQASAPVQVITGHPCYEIPPAAPACDHMEESVFPSETFGKDYIVTRPAGPLGNAVAHQVRIYGNFDNTRLTYNPVVPSGCPTSINAGDVFECGINAPCPTVVDPTMTYNCALTEQDFEVIGDQPFAVATFSLGGSLVDPTADPTMSEGDPAESMVPAIEQYRSDYVFLAPNDYISNFVDIIAQPGTSMMLDNAPVTATPEPIGTTGYSIYRVKLTKGAGAGEHVLSAPSPVGIQVVGYGNYTSYMYPGGLNLAQIALPAVPR